MTHERIPKTALSRGPVDSLPQLAARYLEEYLDKIRLSVERLNDEELWWRPTQGTNGVGNLMLHLEGNLSLWILAALGGREYVRDRAGEFAAEGGSGRDELLERLTTVIRDCRSVLEGLEGEDLAVEVGIQGYRVDRLGALFHAVEHMSYHTGQIVWITKRLRGGEGFEFYPQHAGE